jgi:hypothetical protein
VGAAPSPTVFPPPSAAQELKGRVLAEYRWDAAGDATEAVYASVLRRRV